MRRPSETWFDRINRYRLAAILLAVPTAIALVDDFTFLGSEYEIVVKILYRIGMTILLVAIAMDWWAVYTGKRKIKRMIQRRKITNPHA